jgi:hypothetical protein
MDTFPEIRVSQAWKSGTCEKVPSWESGKVDTQERERARTGERRVQNPWERKI